MGISNLVAVVTAFQATAALGLVYLVGCVVAPLRESITPIRVGLAWLSNGADHP